MARRVDDIDFYAVVADSRRFGENRDTTLPLEIIGIDYPLDDLFVGSENAALAQHCVDERRLAVVNVSDDCYVSNLIIRHNHPLYLVR